MRSSLVNRGSVEDHREPIVARSNPGTELAPASLRRPGGDAADAAVQQKSLFVFFVVSARPVRTARRNVGRNPPWAALPPHPCSRPSRRPGWSSWPAASGSPSSTGRKEAQIARLLDAAPLRLPALLGHLYRDELRAACREHGLPIESRSRTELAGRLLDAAGLPRSRDTIPPLLAPAGHRDTPRAGDVVMVRRRNYLVDRVHEPVGPDDAIRVALICLDDDNQGRRTEVLWELGARVLSERDHGLGDVERLDPPRTFSAYYNALRWNLVTATDARLFQAPFRAGVQLMHHQLTPLKRALELPRANLFIADDVGLGKTIEAGLVMQELRLRNQIDTVLIVAPASVCPQWQREMSTRFGQGFELYNRAFVQRRRQDRGFGVNPWGTHARFVISYQTLRRPEYKEPLHQMLKEGRRRTLHGAAAQVRPARARRRRPLPRAPGARTTALSSTSLISLEITAADAPELELARMLSEYTRLMAPARGRDRLVFVNLQKRLLSSVPAFCRTLDRHAPGTATARVAGAGAAPGVDPELDDEDDIDDELRDAAEAAADAARAARLPALPATASDLLARMRRLALQRRELPCAKVTALVAWICAHLLAPGKGRGAPAWTERRVIVFTEYGDTKTYLVAQLAAALGLGDDPDERDARILQFHGGMSDDQRALVQRAFNGPPDEYPVRILIATDAARAGLNLQGYCADLFHFDIPWNPARMEQRNGRIDRALQREPVVRCHYFTYRHRPEDHVLDTLVKKVAIIQQELGHHLLGIRVSLSTLSESEEIVSDAVAAPVDEARLHALSERVKHVDATTWSCAGAYRCLWTMATAAVTVFMIATDGTQAKRQVWMSRVRGVLVTERGSQFGFWAMAQRQICWAHLLRKFASFATRSGEAGQLGDKLLLWTRVMFHNWHRVRDGTMTHREFREFAGNLRLVIERLLEEGTVTSGISGSCKNILDHRAALWRFVNDRDVDPTNNHAERELRGFVLWRKGCYGSRSERGDVFAANLKSVVHTCRKQGRAVLPYLTATVHAALRGEAAPSLLGPDQELVDLD